LNKAWKKFHKLKEEILLWERFFELALSKVTWGHRYKLFKKRKIRAEIL